MTDTFSSPRHDARTLREPEAEPYASPAAAAAAPLGPTPEAPRARRPRVAKARAPDAAAPAPQPAPAPEVALEAAPASQPAAARAQAPEVPPDFVTETEHPVLPIPFWVQLGEARLQGTGLSVTAAHVAIAGPLDPTWSGHREMALLQFEFGAFGVTLSVEVAVAGSREPGEMTLRFTDPLGPHLPQLRHVINSFIAGDLVSMGGLLSYAGPTRPKVARTADPVSLKFRLRGLGVAALSAALIAAAGLVMLTRATTAVEPRPVFVERQGRDMRATTAGQVSFLNPAAREGEVVFSINSNAGDVLNFQLPCDCEVAVTEGIFEGATVLPTDLILSFFESNTGPRVQTQITIEGLARVMSGDRAYLDLSDGRTLPVRVDVSSATNAAAFRGDLLVPVTLVPADGALGTGDIGMGGQLRLATPWLPRLPFTSGEDA